jgi:hypothetical protein
MPLASQRWINRDASPISLKVGTQNSGPWCCPITNAQAQNITLCFIAIYIARLVLFERVPVFQGSLQRCHTLADILGRIKDS